MASRTLSRTVNGCVDTDRPTGGRRSRPRRGVTHLRPRRLALPPRACALGASCVSVLPHQRPSSLSALLATAIADAIAPIDLDRGTQHVMQPTRAASDLPHPLDPARIDVSVAAPVPRESHSRAPQHGPWLPLRKSRSLPLLTVAQRLCVDCESVQRGREGGRREGGGSLPSDHRARRVLCLPIPPGRRGLGPGEGRSQPPGERGLDPWEGRTQVLPN